MNSKRSALDDQITLPLVQTSDYSAMDNYQTLKPNRRSASFAYDVIDLPEANPIEGNKSLNSLEREGTIKMEVPVQKWKKKSQTRLYIKQFPGLGAYNGKHVDGLRDVTVTDFLNIRMFGYAPRKKHSWPHKRFKKCEISLENEETNIGSVPKSASYQKLPTSSSREFYRAMRHDSSASHSQSTSPRNLSATSGHATATLDIKTPTPVPPAPPPNQFYEVSNDFMRVAGFVHPLARLLAGRRQLEQNVAVASNASATPTMTTAAAAAAAAFKSNNQRWSSATKQESQERQSTSGGCVDTAYKLLEENADVVRRISGTLSLESSTRLNVSSCWRSVPFGSVEKKKVKPYSEVKNLRIFVADNRRQSAILRNK
uniref:Uncharacterized protein n=1 Tax=Romanomermis culicivorax TaxID=13658 RepID=A0A915HLR3_ROMCU